MRQPTCQKSIDSESFNFLAGLNPEYEQTRALILGRKLFPTLMRATLCKVKNQEGR